MYGGGLGVTCRVLVAYAWALVIALCTRRVRRGTRRW